jgi:hypothetical protein
VGRSEQPPSGSEFYTGKSTTVDRMPRPLTLGLSNVRKTRSHLIPRRADRETAQGKREGPRWPSVEILPY